MNKALKCATQEKMICAAKAGNIKKICMNPAIPLMAATVASHTCTALHASAMLS